MPIDTELNTEKLEQFLGETFWFKQLSFVGDNSFIEDDAIRVRQLIVSNNDTEDLSLLFAYEANRIHEFDQLELIPSVDTAFDELNVLVNLKAGMSLRGKYKMLGPNSSRLISISRQLFAQEHDMPIVFLREQKQRLPSETLVDTKELSIFFIGLCAFLEEENQRGGVAFYGVRLPAHLAQ